MGIGGGAGAGSDNVAPRFCGGQRLTRGEWNFPTAVVASELPKVPWESSGGVSPRARERADIPPGAQNGHVT